MTPNRQRILAALPATQAELCERLFLSKATVSRLCRDLVESRDAHISKYTNTHNGGHPVLTYSVGKRPDFVRRWRTGDSAKRSRIYKAEMIKSGRWEDIKERRRELYALKRGIPKPFNLMKMYGRT